MNKQEPPGGIEWTRVYGRDGYTWNAVSGCQHACRWKMPSGEIAICYAEDVAENSQAKAFYPEGFSHHYWNPKRLEEPLRIKKPSGIFLDSMADLMGHWVSDDEINQVLAVCEKAHWHIFQLLTKNAPRLLKFHFPKNVWVGVSSPPDYFMGRELSQDQKERMLYKSLSVLSYIGENIRWMSFEPLSWDVSSLVSQNKALDWSVIGAASNGRKKYQPDPENVKKLHMVLDEQGVPVFHKGNLEWQPHREEFPS